jgi:hypothetical protein
MSFLSSSDKAVQSGMEWSITPIWTGNKGQEIQTAPLPSR